MERLRHLPNADTMVNELLSGENYKKVFEYKAERDQFTHPYTRVLERAVNRQVADTDSWGEFQGLVEYISQGLPIAGQLDLDVLGKLYTAQRRAFFRRMSDFQGGHFTEDINRQLEEVKEEAVKDLSKASKDLHIKFTEAIFESRVFPRRTKTQPPK